MAKDIDQLCINTIRTLSIDAIQKANSGHPGTPMALAPVAYTLWQRFLRFDPADPIWPNRDRFVLSAGHASMLLYSLLHLADVQAVEPDYEVVGRPSVSLDDIKSFRQLDSRAPGHPEYRWTSGVETTTGPLGQGIATSVGMAIASKWQGARYGAELFDFDVYAIAGDGCLMEGVSNEAASIAGHLKLDNLCWIYDNNHITIDGHTELAYGDDVPLRFEGYGWNIVRVEDANDTRPDRNRLRGVQGRGGATDADRRRHPHRLGLAAQAGHRCRPRRAARRGGGARDQARLRLARGRPVPRPGRGQGALRRRRRRCAAPRRAPTGRRSWRPTPARTPDLAAEIEVTQKRDLPDGWDAGIPSFEPDEKGLATRKASSKVENAIAERVPWLLAGSADLTDSTSVRLDFDGAVDFEPGAYDGRQLHFGIREHESAAISNGLSLSKLRPFWSTYLTFSDYARPAIRLSALMELPVIHLFTHDSIGLGEDGPTHQPVEQLASLRAIPGLDVIRPADANEVAEAWRVAIDRTHQPVALVLTRQNVPIFDRERYASAEGLRRGGYVLAETGRDGSTIADGVGDGEPDLILIATGSEVALARRRARGARRRRRALARRQPALLGAVRPPGGRRTATRYCRRA